jgi:deoxycytidine triphosphate deaminase
MTTAETVQELHQALQIRCAALERLVTDLSGNLGKSWTSLQDTLQLVAEFPAEVVASAAVELALNNDPDPTAQYISILLRHLNLVIDFVEEHLSHGTRPELSDALAEEIREEMVTLGLTDWSLCMSHGGPNNFVTTYGDIAGMIYAPLAIAGGRSRPARKVALFKIPRVVGSGVLWRPVLLGHEVAHVAITEHQALASFDLDPKFDFAAAGSLPNPNTADPNDPASVTAGLYKIAEKWAIELLCDAQSLRRFGPASICALAEYLTCIDSMESPSITHPPGHLRIKLLEQQLGQVTDARIQEMLKPWLNATPTNLSFIDPWANHLANMFLTHGSQIAATVAALPGTTYDWPSRVDRIHRVADDLVVGLTAQVVNNDGHANQISDSADVINASWIARREEADSPYDQLAQKSLVDIQFVRAWDAAGGTLPPAIESSRELVGPASSAVLAAAEVAARIATPAVEKRLEIRPLLHAPGGTGVDLRLGSRFIVFRRRGVSAFDPLDEDLDPRAVQQSVELAPGEVLILHPNEIVLGATMEYLGLPADLSGQVITRSSYGRLGLLTATAVQVHPGFRGCLTLELVNLSTIPITLTPGERIAQLVLWHSFPAEVETGKYNCPTGPEFSKVRSDPEAAVLRKLFN